jgi:transcriptional regulator with XRE-family HTH domain
LVTAVQEPNPTAARRELALYFRTLREQRKRSLEELAEYLGVSEAQASRLDKGARGLSAVDVRKLADEYNLPAGERERLVALAMESRKRGWWQQVELPAAYRSLIGMEQVADSINEYCTSVIPGLLQTREYAHAAATASTVGLRRDHIELAVNVRMQRQRVLERTPPPRLWAVIDESAFARGAGGPAVMRAQLEHLIAATERPEIKVQVIAFEYGVHPGINSHFILLDTDGALPDLVYVEGLRGHAESDSNEEVRRYRRIWDSLRALALSFPDSRALMERYVEKYSPP